MDDQIFGNSREAQPMFQKIKIQLQHGGNSYLRGGCQQRTNLNGTRKDQGSKRMEDTNKSKGHRELPGIHKLLPMFHTKLQSHGQAIK